MATAGWDSTRVHEKLPMDIIPLSLPVSDASPGPLRCIGRRSDFLVVIPADGVILESKALFVDGIGVRMHNPTNRSPRGLSDEDRSHTRRQGPKADDESSARSAEMRSSKHMIAGNFQNAKQVR